MNSQSSTTNKNSVSALVSLGSNLSYDRSTPQDIVLAAMEALRQLSHRSKSSSLYRSTPLDCPAGSEDFVNAAMRLELPREISALQCLALLQQIEADFGRKRGDQRNAPRTLDLDIISYDNQRLTSSELVLPHPRATQRKFVLLPLKEIDPEIVLPGETATISQLLDRLAQQETVQRLP